MLGRNSGDIEHIHFRDVINYLEPGDTLFLMIHVLCLLRLFGLKEETGAKVEMLMLTQIENNDWEVLLKPAKRIKIGHTSKFRRG
ncbi:S-adenosylmethionine:tRNA ribosyltransferase-isomerase [Staphylococcus haemolyticus]|uniref:S-adenosylmethionine:tRNA ribosyltransferase-isomerase n=1 Tax=Staphylococcus haemolyticus TaxID=1283 RepID=UPI003D9632D7